jgi:hypothetical protein
MPRTQNQFALVRQGLGNLTPEQAADILPFFEELSSISRMRIGQKAKFQRAIRLVWEYRRRSVHFVFKLLVTAIEAIRSWRPGLGLSFLLAGAAAGFAAFGSEAAGLAAMGSAVAVPLWLVTSAGSTMLGVVLDELRNKARRSPTPSAGSDPAEAAASNAIACAPHREVPATTLAAARTAEDRAIA